MKGRKMSETTLSEKFVSIYNELSEYMEKELHEKDFRSHVQMLNIMSKKNHIIKENYEELRTFANLRNVIVHDSTGNYNPIAEPHEEVVKRYQDILNRLKNPPTALDISTKAKDMFFAHLNMRLIDCIKKMHDKNFSYIPVCADYKLLGVLSGDSIFTYMRRNATISIHEDFKISDLGDSIKNHIDERYCFVSKDMPLNEVTNMYINDIKDGKRLGAVFVTKTGHDSEKILGMISAWDLIDFIGKDEA